MIIKWFKRWVSKINEKYSNVPNAEDTPRREELDKLAEYLVYLPKFPLNNVTYINVRKIKLDTYSSNIDDLISLICDTVHIANDKNGSLNAFLAKRLYGKKNASDWLQLDDIDLEEAVADITNYLRSLMTACLNSERPESNVDRALSLVLNDLNELVELLGSLN